MMTTIVDKFTGEFRFLSTFYPCTVSFEGKLYKSVEHAYQASKTTDLKSRDFIRTLNAGHARRYGEALVPHAAWNGHSVMENLMLQKIDNPFIRPSFEALKGRSIVFGNTWHDNVLGACSCKKCVILPKENVLGKLIEKLCRNVSFEKEA